ncbi:hypothetical protein GN958_ATG04473 [Phytophthora infestans]|uniref:Uncharacterized protein n=1 Tax=Phytophthora infestans TaxID=4787 RepID=A0A8S9V064_PHYIN|nr:hypothetical protein GN958_ATG04473 [Phytophthora infestans]
MDNKQMVVFNFSALSTHKNKTFEDNFKKQCEIDWKELRGVFGGGLRVANPLLFGSWSSIIRSQQ